MVRASAKEILASVHRHHDRRHDKTIRYRRDTRRPNILSRECADAKDMCEFQRKAARYSDLIAATVPS
jgi:hypothetical protein